MAKPTGRPIRNELLATARTLIQTEGISVFSYGALAASAGIKAPSIATVAERVRFRVGNINAGNVGAPAQLREIAATMLTAIINHEYQHSTWIGEVRVEQHGKALPPQPISDRLREIDGYVILT